MIGGGGGGGGDGGGVSLFLENNRKRRSGAWEREGGGQLKVIRYFAFRICEEVESFHMILRFLLFPLKTNSSDVCEEMEI